MITCVIVNYFSEHLLLPLCEQLEISHLISNIIIVDNSNSLVSDDHLGKKSYVIKPGKNLGFGAAVNMAVVGIQSKYFLVLNPDVILDYKMLDCFLQKAIPNLSTDNRLLSVNPKTVNTDGVTNHHSIRRPTAWRFFISLMRLNRLKILKDSGLQMNDSRYYHSDLQHFHCLHCFTLFSTLNFKKLGGYDEKFFVFYEDLDLSTRAEKYGLINLYLGQFRFVHAFNSGSGVTMERRRQLSRASKRLFIEKHVGNNSLTKTLLILIVKLENLIWK